MIANLRRLASGAPGAAGAGAGTLEEPATSAGPSSRRSTATCSTSTSGGSSAPASPAWRCARRTGPTGRPAPGCSGWRTSELPEDLWATAADPDRPRLLHALELGRARSSASTRAPRVRPNASWSWAAWEDLCAANPVLDSLEPDVEGLIVNRISEPAQFAIAPIDECYRLVGAVKASWEGISGGGAVERVVPAFFEEICRRAAVSAGEPATFRPRRRRRRRQRRPPGGGAASGGRGRPRRPRAGGDRAGPGRPWLESRSAGSSRCSRRGSDPRPSSLDLRRPLRPRGLHDRARGADRDRAGSSAATTRRPASG